MKKMLTLILAAAMVLTLAACGQEKPTENNEEGEAAWRPDGSVDLIVASSPGGSMDSAARLFAKRAEDVCGVKINVVNNTDGGGTVAMVEVENADAEGLTLGHFGTNIVTDQFNIKDCPYDSESYRYVGLHTSEASYLIVSAKGPFADMNFDEFCEYAKANPGKVRIAISGTWNNYDCTRHMIEQAKGIEFKRVAIKGGSNCLLSTIAGDVDATICQFVEAEAQIEAGECKAIAMSGEERNPLVPDCVTLSESGIDYTLCAPKVIVLPASTPDDVYEGWVDIFTQMMKDPDTQTMFEELGLTFTPIIGEAAHEYVKNYGEVVKTNFVDTGVFGTPLT